MRFESKHRYFKRAVLNFINIIKSLGEKHELFQSYIRLGSDLRLDLDVYEYNSFNITTFNDGIRAVVTDANLSNPIQECYKVIVKGTNYEKGDIMVIRQEGYQNNIVLGKINLLLYSDESIFILFEIFESHFIPHLRIYALKNFLRYECLQLDNLIYYKPMKERNLKGCRYIVPHYGFVSSEMI